jgi:4-hydroxy-2-oxoheptanedioate aldolase
MRAKLHQGERVYGTMVNAVSPRWPGVLSGLGLDFVFIDTEHSAQDRTQLAWMCQLYAAQGVVPVVRIPSPDPYQACMVLDGGGQGVIAPYIETPDQVRELVGAVKYRPLKGARLYNRLSGQGKLEPELETYLDRRNENNLLIVNIESRPALNALDDILAVDGLDGVLIGPHDLSCNLGIPEQYFHPTQVQAVDEVIQKARGCNIGAGIHVFYPDALEQEARWVKLGANIIVHGVDAGVFRTAMQRDLDVLKTLLDD